MEHPTRPNERDMMSADPELEVDRGKTFHDQMLSHVSGLAVVIDALLDRLNELEERVRILEDRRDDGDSGS